MKSNDKIETLQHTMDRYDHYFNSVNNKGSLYLALNTFLLGGIVTGFYSIKGSISERCDSSLFAYAGLICCLLSIGFTLWAIFPYFSKHNPGNDFVLYFENVSNYSLNIFKKMYDEMTEDSLYEDYLRQVHLLAIGLHQKFYRLQVATYLLVGCFICIVAISGILILNKGKWNINFTKIMQKILDTICDTQKEAILQKVSVSDRF